MLAHEIREVIHGIIYDSEAIKALVILWFYIDMNKNYYLKEIIVLGYDILKINL